MSNTKFTQGPWKVEVNTDLRGNPRSLSIVPAARPGKRNIIAYTPDGTTAEHRANAALLAAAPDLYHELEDSARLMCNNCNQCELNTNGKPMFASQVCETYMRKVAVLRKARGEI